MKNLLYAKYARKVSLNKDLYTFIYDLLSIPTILFIIRWAVAKSENLKRKDGLRKGTSRSMSTTEFELPSSFVTTR